MSAAVKGVAGVGIPVAGIGGTYLYLNSERKGVPEMPGWNPPIISKSDSYFKGYEPYLVSYGNDASDIWLGWSYENRFKKADSNSLSDHFRNTSDLTIFKEKCGVAYEKSANEISGDDGEKFVSDVWRFCSIFDAKPKTVDEVTGESKLYEGRIGESKKNELVSVTDNGLDNKKFWEIREKLFFGEKGSNGRGHHSKQTSDSKTLFDSFYDTKNNKKTTLKKICEDAYKVSSTSSTPSTTESEVVKHCGLKVS